MSASSPGADGSLWEEEALRLLPLDQGRASGKDALGANHKWRDDVRREAWWV